MGVQHMQLPHEKGAAALGQELSAFGWALYDLDEEDEYLFVLIPEREREAFEAFCKQRGGDTVARGWARFAVGLNREGQRELDDTFEEIEYDGSTDNFFKSVWPRCGRQPSAPCWWAGSWRKSAGSRCGWRSPGWPFPRTGWKHFGTFAAAS